MKQPYSNKNEILGQLYMNYKEDEQFSDFIEYNDIGLPLAYFASEGMCELSEEGNKYVDETWQLFLAGLGIQDTGFESLDQIFDSLNKEE